MESYKATKNCREEKGDSLSPQYNGSILDRLTDLPQNGDSMNQARSKFMCALMKSLLSSADALSRNRIDTFDFAGEFTPRATCGSTVLATRIPGDKLPENAPTAHHARDPMRARIRSGESCRKLSTIASASDSSSRWSVPVRAIAVIPARFAAVMPCAASSTTAQCCWRHAEPLRRQQKHLRIGFAARDVGAGHHRVESCGRP